MTAPPTEDARLTAALDKIKNLEREKSALDQRLETLGAELSALRASRTPIDPSLRYKGRLVVIGLVLVILAVFGSAVIMYVQLRHDGPPPRVELPGTPHGTAIPGFPPPPPDPGNAGSAAH